MKQILLIALICLSILVLGNRVSLAETSTPKAIVEEMVTRLKASGDATVVLDYVHWPTAFANLPLNERRLMEISSPEELREYVKSMVSNPQEFVRKEFASRMQNVAPKDRETAKHDMEITVAKIQEQKTQIQKSISRTEYKIGEPDQTSDTNVTIPIIASLDGQTKTSSVALQQIEGKWYLPAMDFVYSQSKAN